MAVGPTSSVRFRLPHPLDISDLRIRLEQIGQITAMLVDPKDGACLVTFKSHDTAQRLVEQALEFGIDGAKFAADADLERRSRELDILPDHAQINNVVQKRFRKTVAEPRIYWAPAIDADDL
jgi:hypothetical protein